MMPFQRVRAWKDAHEFALTVNEEADRWPRHEMFVLTAQVRRASISIPANIAEGAGKRGSREYRRYLDVALGSFSELTYLLIFARDRQYLAPDRWQGLESRRELLGRTLWRLYESVSRHAASQ
jgi:four helix bundle protein